MNFFERVEMKRLVYVFAMAIAIPVNSNAGIVINGAIAAGGAVALAAKSRIKCEPVDPSFSANSGRGGACRDCDYSISSRIEAYERALLHKKGQYISKFSKEQLPCNEVRSTKLLVSELILEESKEKEQLWKLSKAILCEAREYAQKPFKANPVDLPKYVIDAAKRHFKRENAHEDLSDYCASYNMDEARKENHAFAMAIDHSMNITAGNIIGKYCPNSSGVTDSDLKGGRLDRYLNYCRDDDGVLRSNPGNL
jgi:hypothetical protein